MYFENINWEFVSSQFQSLFDDEEDIKVEL